MNVAGRIGNDELGEFPIDIAQIGRSMRKGDTKPRTDLIRYRLPDRTIPDVGDVIDHVIEHAMTKRADIVPVFRIERFAGFGLRLRFAQHLHAACSCPRPARAHSIAAKASKILRICGGLYGNSSGESMLCTTAVLSASKINKSPRLFSAQSIVK